MNKFIKFCCKPIMLIFLIAILNVTVSADEHLIISDYQTHSGQITNAEIIDGGTLILKGMATGSIIVRSGGNLDVYGMVDGQIINQGGNVRIRGVSAAIVHQRGVTEIYGMVTTLSGSGQVEIKQGAVVKQNLLVPPGSKIASKNDSIATEAFKLCPTTFKLLWSDSLTVKVDAENPYLIQILNEAFDEYPDQVGKLLKDIQDNCDDENAINAFVLALESYASDNVGRICPKFIPIDPFLDPIGYWIHLDAPLFEILKQNNPSWFHPNPNACKTEEPFEDAGKTFSDIWDYRQFLGQFANDLHVNLISKGTSPDQLNEMYAPNFFSQSIPQFSKSTGSSITESSQNSALVSAVTNIAGTGPKLKVPSNAVQVQCRQEFKDLTDRFYQFFIMELDTETTKSLGSPRVDGMLGALLGEHWKRTGMVYLKVGESIKRLVGDVAFFPNTSGNGGAISGLEGYRYGSMGVMSGNGVFVEYETKQSLTEAVFDEIMGCYIIK